MQARMKSPALLLSGAFDALQKLHACTTETGLSRVVSELVGVRTGQINGCSVCVDMHSRALRKLGESDARIFSIATWREAPYYTDAERAALALAEATTRLADGHDVSDAVWSEASRHFEGAQLAALV